MPWGYVRGCSWPRGTSGVSCPDPAVFELALRDVEMLDLQGRGTEAATAIAEGPTEDGRVDHDKGKRTLSPAAKPGTW
ncbi:hypothetical protein NDU88_000126 [Pleurodeles waltl]|uniref:Uncharacterized protein n=1 Tax=Pleurodeles waltl TaxID=8319 RepID=A0AAV7UP33_PLEWA|nr:hypothetical protein NDU88_000126 [Pleurodeles waltl]